MRYFLPLLILLAACSSTPPTTAGSGVTARLVRVSGDSQSGIVGYQLDNPVVLRVVDSSGAPMSGVSVVFAIDPADLNSVLPTGLIGQLSTSGRSDVNGLVSAFWRLGGSLGTQHLTVAVTGNLAAANTVSLLTATAQTNAVLSVDGGRAGLCAIDLAGRLGCWQPPNLFRAPATTALPARMKIATSPVAFTTVAMMNKTAGTTASGCALATTGRVWCFNADSSGTVSGLAQLPGGYPAFIRLAGTGSTGASFCALAADGSAWCWGDNYGGVLGDGTQIPQAMPVAVPTAARFVSLDVTDDEACGLTVDGQTWCWGDNYLNQVGTQTFTPGVVTPVGPTLVSTSARFSQIALYSFGNMACGVATDGIYCWGDVSAFGPTISSFVPDTTSTPRLMAPGQYLGVAWGGSEPFFFLGFGGSVQFSVTGEICPSCSLTAWNYAPALATILETQGGGMICGGTLPSPTAPVLCMDTDRTDDEQFAGFPPTFGVPFP